MLTADHVGQRSVSSHSSRTHNVSPPKGSGACINYTAFRSRTMLFQKTPPLFVRKKSKIKLNSANVRRNNGSLEIEKFVLQKFSELDFEILSQEKSNPMLVIF